MAKSKIVVTGVAVLVLLAAAVMAKAESGQVSQVVYITKSKACGCSAKIVQAADALVDRTFTGPRQALLKRIDYDTDRQAALPYIGQFRLIRLPALLFLDDRGHLLWSAVGEVEPKQVAQKLDQLGG